MKNCYQWGDARLHHGTQDKDSLRITKSGLRGLERLDVHKDHVDKAHPLSTNLDSKNNSPEIIIQNSITQGSNATQSCLVHIILIIIIIIALIIHIILIYKI